MDINSKKDIWCWALGKTLVDFFSWILALAIVGTIPGTILYFVIDKPELGFFDALQGGFALTILVIWLCTILGMIFDGLKFVFKKLKQRLTFIY